MSNKMYHLGCRKGEIKKYSILFGDPDRCDLIKPLLGRSRLVSSQRGFVLYNSEYKNIEFTFGGLGIGGPSWAIGLHELSLSGSELFIRVGTSGIIDKGVKPGDLIIPNYTFSDEGCSKYIVGTNTELVPDDCLIQYLKDSSKKLGFKYHIGPVHSKDFLYIEEPEEYPLNDMLQSRMQEIKELGALVTEMECATLFAFGIAQKTKTAAVLAAIDEDYDLSQNSQKKAFFVALEALKKYHGDKYA